MLITLCPRLWVPFIDGGPQKISFDAAARLLDSLPHRMSTTGPRLALHWRADMIDGESASSRRRGVPSIRKHLFERLLFTGGDVDLRPGSALREIFKCADASQCDLERCTFEIKAEVSKLEPNFVSLYRSGVHCPLEAPQPKSRRVLFAERQRIIELSRSGHNPATIYRTIVNEHASAITMETGMLPPLGAPNKSAIASAPSLHQIHNIVSYERRKDSSRESPIDGSDEQTAHVTGSESGSGGPFPAPLAAVAAAAARGSEDPHPTTKSISEKSTSEGAVGAIPNPSEGPFKKTQSAELIAPEPTRDTHGSSMLRTDAVVVAESVSAQREGAISEDSAGSQLHVVEARVADAVESGSQASSLVEAVDDRLDKAHEARNRSESRRGRALGRGRPEPPRAERALTTRRADGVVNDGGDDSRTKRARGVSESGDGESFVQMVLGDVH
jgi:hypothetical protein